MLEVPQLNEESSCHKCSRNVIKLNLTKFSNRKDLIYVGICVNIDYIEM